MVNVKEFGATGSGTVDDYKAVRDAVAAIGTDSDTLYFPPGEYCLTQAVVLEQLSAVKIYGPGATILFPSSTASLGCDPDLDLASQPDCVPLTQDNCPHTFDGATANIRSAFYLRDSADIAFEDIGFRGDAVKLSGEGNIGHAVAAHDTCQRLRMTRVRQWYGAGLVSMQAGSAGAVIEGCYSYGSRRNSLLGNDGTFRDCTFELPFDDNQYDTSAYGPGGQTGSSHAIYIYASAGSRTAVDGCVFINVREDGVKMSGSSGALCGLQIVNNRFHNCGYYHDGTSASGSCVLFGADDNQLHSTLSVENNQFFDCQSWITVLGAQNVKIANNQGHRTTLPREPSNTLIQVTRYKPTSQPVADVLIDGNIASSLIMTDQPFTAEDTGVVTTRNSSGIVQTAGWPTGFGPIHAIATIGGALPGGLDATSGYYWIALTAAGGTGRLATTVEDAHAGTSVDIMSAGSGVFIVADEYAVCAIDVEFVGEDLPGRSSPPVIVNNLIGHGVGADIQVTAGANPIIRGNVGDAGVTVTGSRMPRIMDHTVNDPTTGNPVIKLNQVAWPVLAGNLASNHLSTSIRGTASTTDNTSDNGPLRFPLAGLSGRVTSTYGHTEVVFAYGYGWIDGDLLLINDTPYRYPADFHDPESLIALIDKPTTPFAACDYGDPWGITTCHIRVRAKDLNANPFYVESRCTRHTAGVVLSNGSGAGQNLCYSVGGGNNYAVIWSPCINVNAVPTLNAENAAAAAVLTAAVAHPVSTNFALEETCCVVMQLGATDDDGSARFQWTLI